MKGLRQEYRSRNQKKGEKSALTGKWESAVSGKPKDSAQKETPAASATNATTVERQQNRLLLLRDGRQKDVRRPSKGKGSRESSPPGKKGQRPCKSHLKGNCTHPSCGCWHSPVCQNYQTESGCTVGDKCLFRHTEADSPPSQKSKQKWWKRIGGLAEKVETFGYSRIQSRRTSKPILR